MGAVLQWRRFNFFDVRSSIDNGVLAETVKDAGITCTGAGRGVLYIADSNGWVHCLNRKFQVSSFQAHTSPITILAAFDLSSRIITVATAPDGHPEVKIWVPDSLQLQGQASCLRVMRPDPRQSHNTQKGSIVPTITALAAHPNMSLMALGFSDGSVMLYRGELSRERGCKSRVVVTVTSGGITNLHLRDGHRFTQLFVTTANKVYSVNCTTRDKETTIELDNIGCQRHCATLADGKLENEFLMARNDAIFTYTNDSRASCYVFEGEKINLTWFKGHLIVVAKEQDTDSIRSTNLCITVYDPVNKLVALSTVVKGFVSVIGEWGGLYLVTPEPALIQLSEKDLHTKLEILFRKNQFDIAISLAKVQCCGQEQVSEILRQYGDWLYSNGNLGTAMDQYIKTIPYLEASYVIKKYLDTQHINHLTMYLQALHNEGGATADHTSLLLNCYTRLKDTQQLDHFITSKGSTLDCDVELGVRVCRGAGYYDHALALAAKHNLHHHHLAILCDDKKDYNAALRYISTLDFYSARDNILRYGSVLLNNAPDETTHLLIKLCTDYKPSNELLVSEESMFGNNTTEEVVKADPEEFEYLLLNHSEATITLLEHITQSTKLSPRLCHTLLGEYLHQYSLCPEGQDESSSYSDKALRLLTNTEGSHDHDQAALLLCDKYKFDAGKLILWERAHMYEQMMTYQAEQQDFNKTLQVCEMHGQDHPKLWGIALKLITSDKSIMTPNPQHLTKILEEIEILTEQKKKSTENRTIHDNDKLVRSLSSGPDFEGVLSPLEVVDILSSSHHVTLGQVRSYLLKVVSNHSAAVDSEITLTQNYSAETARMRESIEGITTGATEFTGTKCNICNNVLELPTVHFLCKHSFHQHCFESYSEAEDECIVCLPEVNKMRQEMREQVKDKRNQEAFQEQLENCNEVFEVVADFLGSGVFTDANYIASMYPTLNTTRVPESEGRMRALEKLNQGPTGVGGEGRLRLGEHQSQGILEVESESRKRSQDRHRSNVAVGVSEGRLRSSHPSSDTANKSEGRSRFVPGSNTGSSNIVIPQSESRLRVGEPFGTSSLREHITPTQSPNTRSIPEMHSQVQSISAAAAQSSPFSSNTNISTFDNPYEKKSVEPPNPFDENGQQEDDSHNPFDDDYDNKNPFSENDDINHSKSEDKTDHSKGDEVLDPTNPFS